MKPKQTKYVGGMIVGGLLLLISPLIAFFGTAYGMHRSFDTLGNSGIQDPKALSGNIGLVLHISAAGLVGFVCGIVILAVSIVLFIRAGERAASGSQSNSQ